MPYAVIERVLVTTWLRLREFLGHATQLNHEQSCWVDTSKRLLEHAEGLPMMLNTWAHIFTNCSACFTPAAGKCDILCQDVSLCSTPCFVSILQTVVRSEHPVTSNGMSAAPRTTLHQRCPATHYRSICHQHCDFVVQAINNQNWTISPYGVLTREGWGWGEAGTVVGVSNDEATAMYAKRPMIVPKAPCTPRMGLHSWQ